VTGREKDLNYSMQIGGLPYAVYQGSEAFFRNHASPFVCAPAEDAAPLEITPAELDGEREKTPQATDYELETVLLLRKVYTHCLDHSRMMIHGGCIVHHGRGYIFTAPSGTGKSTHIALWKQQLGADVTILNGDKPMLEFGETIIAHGTPWNGKEGWGENISAPVAAVVVIRRGNKNIFRRLDTTEATIALLPQAFSDHRRESMRKVLQYLHRIISEIPVFELCCDVSVGAFQCCFDGLAEKCES